MITEKTQYADSDDTFQHIIGSIAERLRSQFAMDFMIGAAGIDCITMLVILWALPQPHCNVHYGGITFGLMHLFVCVFVKLIPTL